MLKFLHDLLAPSYPSGDVVADQGEGIATLGTATSFDDAERLGLRHDLAVGRVTRAVSRSGQPLWILRPKP